MKQIFRNSALVAILGVLAACAASPPGVDERFGEAVEALTAEQIANAAAVPADKSLPGLDGKAAKGVVELYHATSQVKEHAPQSVFSPGLDQSK